MTSKHSDTESNVSGFFRYSDDNIKKLYSSVIKNLRSVNQDALEIQRNLTNIMEQAGPLEKQLVVLQRAFPKPTSSMIVDEE